VRIFFTTSLFCLIFALTFNVAFCQDSSTVSLKDIKGDIDHFNKEIQRQIELNQSLLRRSEQTFELASKIIDWSAMFFASLTLILIIAGAVGLKEFSNIRKIEAEMSSINKEMKNEIENVRKAKSEIQKDLDDLKANIAKDSREFLRIVYLLNDGIASYHTGDLSNAIEAFLKVKQINPNDYEATCYLARSYVGQEKYDLAIETAKTALTLPGKHALAYSIMGEAYRRMKKFDLAIDSFKKAINIEKKPSTLNNLGFSYYYNKEYDSAISIFRESLDMKRKSTACCGLAKSLIKKQMREEAVKYLHETIVLSEESIARGTIYVWPYYSLAFSHLVLNNRNDCINALKIALDMNKNPAIIKEQLIDFHGLKDESEILQELLGECLEQFDKVLMGIKKVV